MKFSYALPYFLTLAGAAQFCDNFNRAELGDDFTQIDGDIKDFANTAGTIFEIVNNEMIVTRDGTNGRHEAIFEFSPAIIDDPTQFRAQFRMKLGELALNNLDQIEFGVSFGMPPSDNLEALVSTLNRSADVKGAIRIEVDMDNGVADGSLDLELEVDLISAIGDDNKPCIGGDVEIANIPVADFAEFFDVAIAFDPNTGGAEMVLSNFESGREAIVISFATGVNLEETLGDSVYLSINSRVQGDGSTPLLIIDDLCVGVDDEDNDDECRRPGFFGSGCKDP